MKNYHIAGIILFSGLILGAALPAKAESLALQCKTLYQPESKTIPATVAAGKDNAFTGLVINGVQFNRDLILDQEIDTNGERVTIYTAATRTQNATIAKGDDSVNWYLTVVNNTGGRIFNFSCR